MLSEEFKQQFTCFGENTKKYITLTIRIKREVTRIGKNEAEITKHIYLTYYNLLIAQGLWQVYYEIVSIIIEKAKRTVF